MIRFLDCSETPLDGYLILARDGLAIEDEEGDDVVRHPLVQVIVDVVPNAGQATEGRQERFIGGPIVEQELDIIGRIDSNGTICNIGYVVVAAK